MLFFSWIFVLIYFLRDVRSKSINQAKHLEECLMRRYAELGPITFHEVIDALIMF